MLYIKRRPPRRYRQGRRKLPRVLFLLAAVLLGAAAFSELALSAISPELTQEAARGYILDCVTKAVEAELATDPSPFVTVERQQDGQVTLVSADPERLNRLKAGVLERLSKTLRGRATAYVPVGSLTGVGLLNGRGFPVPIKLQLEGSAVAEFSTDFTSAGLNQTCHRLTLTVRARAYSQSRRFETAVEAETTTVLAETMVVGEVPKLMTGGTVRNQS
ncbi:sporulation protein YunB [Acutalibacter caecimuris]|uniref:sporulation protein YunB n=1 Tax=Acutalibacter caecimuris TaxID=3093657 RepID=UPI002AC9E75F|nr:sporulation protein YunB [Acutalibacter sp. M00118]